MDLAPIKAFKKLIKISSIIMSNNFHSLSKEELKDFIKGKLKAKTITAINKHIKTIKMSFWSDYKTRDFENILWMLALYRDMMGIGYDDLHNKIKHWFKGAKKMITT